MRIARPTKKIFNEDGIRPEPTGELSHDATEGLVIYRKHWLSTSGYFL